MKKFLASLLVLVMAIALVPQGLFTIDVHAATSGDFTYTVSNGEATITDFPTSYSGKVTIPSTLGGYPVTSIGSYAFTYCNVTSVTIGNSVESIGEYAFRECTALTSVTIGNSVENIDIYAFYGCIGLSSVTIGNSVASIGEYAFSNCTGLLSFAVDVSNTNFCSDDGVLFNKDQTKLIQYPAGKTAKSYIIPNSVTIIGNGAFFNCTSLTAATIGNSVTSIGNYAFTYCSSLISITIGNSVKSIGHYAFTECTGLTSVFIGNSVESIGHHAFDSCFDLTRCTIGNSVKSIGNYAFYQCFDLTSITIPNSVTSIGNFAFYFCRELTSVSIPNSIISIGDYAFKECIGLTSISIGNSVTSIGSYAFYDCSGLTSITIPDSVTSIGDHAFSYCRKLTSITIPNSVTSIGSSVFWACTSLTSVTIPDSVTNIASYAFYACTSLTDVYYTGTSAQRNAMTIGRTDNEYLLNATWHYNTCSTTHTYSAACDTICNHCDWVRIETSEHTFDHICDLTCNNCGHVRSMSTNVIDHVFDHTCDTTCNRCAFTRSMSNNVEDHVFEYVCDTKCSRCSFTRTTIHTYSNVCDAFCNVCQEQRSVPDHIYDNDCDTTCNICSMTRTVPDHPYTLNGGHTCASCKISLKPEAPKAIEILPESITLELHEGFEYSRDKYNWQASNVFTGLTENRAYTFYQRVAASDVAKQSETSLAVTIRTQVKLDCLNTPIAPIIADETVNSITLAAMEGYEYKCGNGSWQDSPVFTGLSYWTPYTFYQRIKETATQHASKASAPTEGITCGGSTVLGYHQFREFIDEIGTTTTSGTTRYRQRISSTSGQYYYLTLENTSQGIILQWEMYGSSSNYQFESLLKCLLTPYQRYLNADYTLDMYRNNNLLTTGTYSARIDRTTYTTDTSISITGAQDNSFAYQYFNADLKLLLIELELLFMDNGMGGIGFIGFLDFKPDSGIRELVCDPASGHHVTEDTNLLYKYASSCMYDGYTGDTCCSYCGETITAGTKIPSRGGHTYSNNCDNLCNSCGEERRVNHSYSNACDQFCNICNKERETIAHIYDSNCDSTCNECNYSRHAPHVYDDNKDLICNNCDYERPPIAYGDVSGDTVIDSRDLVLIRKFMANFDYDTNTSTVEVAGGADTNGDGGIDARDLVLLRQYFANYDYDSGSSSVVLGPQN